MCIRKAASESHHRQAEFLGKDSPMSNCDLLHDLLVSLDAYAKPCGRVYDWPMNEASVLLEMSEAGDRLKAILRDDAFPDGAGLCLVLKGAEAGCPGTCGSCEMEMAPGELAEEFVMRARRFCDRICERMVAHEDRFLSGFLA
jgi:hypothetical protein